MAAIDERAGEAENPPIPPDPSGTPPARRGMLMIRAATLAAVTAGAAAVALAWEGFGREPDSSARNPSATPASRSPSSSVTSPSPSPSDSAEPIAVQFRISGDGPLTSLTYGVNAHQATLENVPLPWRKTIEVPAEPGVLDYRLEPSPPSGGDVTCRLLIDGSVQWSETLPGGGELAGLIPWPPDEAPMPDV
jgi:hypothetical protein